MTESFSEEGNGSAAPLILGPSDRPLQRVGRVREDVGMTRRMVARRLGLSVAEVKRLEIKTTDFYLSLLYQLAELFDEPPDELLLRDGDPLSGMLLPRAKMVRIIKTVLGLREAAKSDRLKFLIQTLVSQFAEMEPELLTDVLAGRAAVSPDAADGSLELLLRGMPEEAFEDDDD